MNHKVSIALPIYNGENYLEETLESLLAQTYSDFELIISDNASTDRTEEICRSLAEKDDRVRYYRNESNVGASENHNMVIPLAKGEYFKWAAHDDLCAPSFLERCVEVLDNDSSIALTYPRTKAIDVDGVVTREYDAKPRFNSELPRERFHECICVPQPQVAIFGLFRKSALEKTRMLGPYSSSDRVLLGEVALHGRVYEIPEFLFFYRVHPKQSWQAHKDRFEREIWFDPARLKQITFPHWRLLQEHTRALMRSQLNAVQKVMCMPVLAIWVRRHWRYLANNLILKEPG